ncbi:MAG: aminotransferase class I/II-fold pyridoxal phosphate-dependent enzyme [Bdellovibrionaceae bacterium]|nr:aminotransferase class I/II-fold pyridoxal phosphate-dependent enzyme [Pseudobdellovibrionaceae bacterium]
MANSDFSNQESSNHEVHLQAALGSAPLAGHINRLLKKPEIVRARRFAQMLDGFHLKNTLTEQVDGRKAVIDGRSVVNFGSANYLGFERHPAVLEAARHALSEWGNHSGCSRIFSSHENIVRLEREIARLVGADESLICANTSQVHQGTIPALFGAAGVTIYLDRYAHTSMHQASLIAVAKGARLQRVDIRDLAAVENQFRDDSAQVKVVMIDGVYSMQGHVPEIRELQKICDRTGTILYIDDAHGIAVYGERGGGVVEMLDLSFENMILTAGLQKGLGAYGGFVAARKPVIDFLRVSSRSYIFSGTLQPQAVEGSLAAIAVCDSDEGRNLRARLKTMSKKVRQGLRELGFVVPAGDSPIVSVAMGAELKTLLAGRKLFDEGVYVNSVLYPATPKGEGLLRISLNAIHTDEEIALLMTAFSALKSYLDGYRSPLGPNFSYLKEFAGRQLRRGRRSSSEWVKKLGL